MGTARVLLPGLLIFPAILAAIFYSAFGRGDGAVGHSDEPVTMVAGPVSLLDGQHWQLGGVSKAGSVLTVFYTGQALVNQDGTFHSNNPAVNLYGVKLQTAGSFAVHYELRHLTGPAGISLYGTPPLIEDEYRVERGTLALALNGTALTVKISNQFDGKEPVSRKYTIAESSAHSLDVSANDGMVEITVDNHLLTPRLPDLGIFRSHNVWFGFTSDSPGGSYKVASLTASSVNGDLIGVVDTRRETIQRQSDGLSELADKKRPGFLLGAAVAPEPLLSDSKYRRILGSFNSITPENVAKMQFIHPLPGNRPSDYNFSDMDALVSIAKRSGMKIHGHNLVFGEAEPQWVQTIAQNDPSGLREIMTSQIKTIVSRYKGEIEGWDVVNEPLADYGALSGQFGLREDIWYKAMGPGYIAAALRAAHQADPGTGLWLNDFGMESDPDRFNAMITLVRWLKAQNVPLTGIGFEAHIDDGDTIQNDTHVSVPMLQDRLDTLNALGLKARFSELDVTNESEYPVFGDVIRACMSRANCTGVTIWGVTDKYSSSGSVHGDGSYSTGIGLPWDANLNPTPAVDYMRRALGG